MADRIRLDGKVAVVTGAAGVIGTATMRLLAQRGARIVAVDRKKAELKDAIKNLPAAADPLRARRHRRWNGHGDDNGGDRGRKTGQDNGSKHLARL